MLKIGLVGVGGISGAHGPAWQEMEDAKLMAVCDIRPERMEQYPDANHYTDFDEMLKNEELDILDICLPTYLHADFAEKALEKGINVLCEKPISLKDSDITRLYDAAKRNNAKFMIAQVVRFWPEYEFIKEIYDSGKYGKLLSGKMTRIGGIPRNTWNNWMLDEEKSGLVPFDLHIHDLDFLVYAFGKPVSVKSSRSKRPEQDSISMIYDFGDAFVSCESAWYAAPVPFEATFRFQFEKAVIINQDGKITVYECDGDVIEANASKELEEGNIYIPKSNAYANEINYFADCVRNGKEPDKVKPEELQTVLSLLKSL